jgi:succinoglycan biosynthesis protein ExoO/succinoglycan biosynthesis protein ExoU
MPAKVSVIVPAHDARDYVGAAIASALAQEGVAVEVIAVDDGSADGTFEALAEWARRDPRVVALRHAAQRGPAAARNTALARAGGDWVTPLDADDAFLPGRLAALVGQAEALGADLLADNLLLRDFATGADLGPLFPPGRMAPDRPVTPVEMIRRDMPDMPTRAQFGFLQPLIRRDLLLRHGLRYRDEMKAAEDFLFYFECVARGARFHLTPEAGYVYAQREGSIAGRPTSVLYGSAGNRRMLRIAAGLGDAELLRALRDRQALLDVQCLKVSLATGRLRDALGYALRVPPGRLLPQLGAAARRRLTVRNLELLLRPYRRCR